MDRKITTITLTLLLSISAFLGFCSLTFNAVSYQGIAQVERTNSLANFVFESHHEIKSSLLLEVEEQDKTLEFMVWPDERRKILQQSVGTTQQLINLEPTKISYWQRLLELQYELDPNPTEISWVLDKLYKLNRWNDRNMITMARYCVPSAFSLASQNPASCTDIVKNLPFQEDERRLARLMGINQQDLAIVLDHYRSQK